MVFPIGCILSTMHLDPPITITEPQSNHFLLFGKLSLDNLRVAGEAFDDRLSTSEENASEEDVSEDSTHEEVATEVRVDLSQLEVEGFAVLALLVHIQRAVQASGGSVRFVNPSTGLVQLATIGGLVDVLSFEPSL